LKTTTAAAAAIAAAALISAATGAHASAFPACAAHQLHVKLGHERAALGSIRLTVTATDDGPACVLSGFPHLGLLGSHRGPLRSETTRTGKPGSLLLLNGLSAHFGLEYGNDGEPGAVRASYLTVGGDTARFPGGVALVYGGQLSETAPEGGVR
jgi:hypothetical protein